MILSPISLIDCAVFVLCLIPNLFYQVGIRQTFHVVVQVLPFLGMLEPACVYASILTPATVFQLPHQLIVERYLISEKQRSPFTQNATLFQDLVVRCVRYAFTNIPAHVARVFFSKWVAYPFFRFRLLRCGYLRMPIQCDELDRYGVKGLWISHDPARKPDVVVYYCHGTFPLHKESVGTLGASSLNSFVFHYLAVIRATKQ